ncbi:DUF2019 domain-containing protein, partial [Myxococcota bacterium]|nr:DUF2019 domain-containing protein [Myxococcota bacterium]
MALNKIVKLVHSFAENVIAQTECIKKGDAQTGNKHAKKYIKAFENLKNIGDEGREGLVPLLYNERDDVRAMAAAFLLRYRHEAAMKVLLELASGDGIVAFSAGETLSRWEENA